MSPKGPDEVRFMSRTVNKSLAERRAKERNATDYLELWTPAP